MSWQKKDSNSKNINQSSLGLPTIFFKNKSILNFKGSFKAPVSNHTKEYIYNLKNDKKSLYSQKLSSRIIDNRLFNEQKIQTSKMLQSKNIKIDENKEINDFKSQNLVRDNIKTSINIENLNKPLNFEILNPLNEVIDYKRKRKSSPNKKFIRQLDREFTLRDKTYLNNPFLFENEYKPIVKIDKSKINTIMSNIEPKRYKINKPICSPKKIVKSTKDIVTVQNKLPAYIHKTKTIAELMSEMDGRRLTFPIIPDTNLLSKLITEEIPLNKIDQRFEKIKNLLKDDVPEPSNNKADFCQFGNTISGIVKTSNNFTLESKTTTILSSAKFNTSAHFNANDENIVSTTKIINDTNTKSFDFKSPNALSSFSINKVDNQNKSDLSTLTHENSNMSNIKTTPVTTNDNNLLKKVTFNVDSSQSPIPSLIIMHSVDVSLNHNINFGNLKNNGNFVSQLPMINNSKAYTLGDSVKNTSSPLHTIEKQSNLFNSTIKTSGENSLVTKFGAPISSSSIFTFDKNSSENINSTKLNKTFTQTSTSVFGGDIKKTDNYVPDFPKDELNSNTKTFTFGNIKSLSQFNAIEKSSNLFNSITETSGKSKTTSSMGIFTTVISSSNSYTSDKNEILNDSSKLQNTIFNQSSVLSSTIPKFSIKNDTSSGKIFPENVSNLNVFAFGQNKTSNDKVPQHSIFTDDKKGKILLQSESIVKTTINNLAAPNNFKLSDNHSTFSFNDNLKSPLINDKTSVFKNDSKLNVSSSNISSMFTFGNGKETIQTDNLILQNRDNINVKSIDSSNKPKTLNSNVFGEKSSTEDKFLFGSSLTAKATDFDKSVETVFGKNTSSQSSNVFGKNLASQASNMFNFSNNNGGTPKSSNIFITTSLTSSSEHSTSSSEPIISSSEPITSSCEPITSSVKIQNNEILNEDCNKKDILTTSNSIFGTSVMKPKDFSQIDSSIEKGSLNSSEYDSLNTNSENKLLPSLKSTLSEFKFGQQTNFKITNNLFNKNSAVESDCKPNLFKQSLGSTQANNPGSNIFDTVVTKSNTDKDSNKSSSIFGSKTFDTNKSVDLFNNKEQQHSSLFNEVNKNADTKTETPINIFRKQISSENNKDFAFQNSDNKIINNDKSSVSRDRIILKRKPKTSTLNPM